MAISLTTDALTRLEAASRLLLDPLAAPDPEAWLRSAGRAVRDLLDGEAVVLAAPGGTLFSDDAPDIATDSAAYVEAITHDGMYFSDPVVDAWHVMRKETGLEAFSWDINERMVRSQGMDVPGSPIMSDVLMGRRLHEFAGLLRTTPEGDAMVWVLGRERGGLRFGEQAPDVLQALVPSFRAGLGALARMGAQRHALDAIAEPLAAYDAVGCERFRNAALVAALDADPERRAVEATLRQVALDVRRLAFPLRHQPAAVPPRAERQVRTARGCYTLHAALVPAGVFVPGEAVLVSVAVATAAPPLTADALRVRFGLTRREAEVALLIAEGLANDAIAERLFIAPGTARRHTEGIFAKLEVGSRAAAAATMLAAA